MASSVGKLNTDLTAAISSFNNSAPSSTPQTEFERQLAHVMSMQEKINSTLASLNAARSSLTSTSIVMANPFAFASLKYGIPEEFLRSHFQELQNYYDASVLTKTCCVKAVRPLEEENLTSSKLQTILMTAMKGTQKEADSLFQFVQTGSNWTCTVEIRGEFLSQVINTDKKAAKEAAAEAALLVLQKHPVYFQHFLTWIPPASDANPTSTLLQFFDTNRLYKSDGNETKAIYRTEGPEGAFTEAHCRLVFTNKDMKAANENAVDLATGSSTVPPCTKRLAQKEASRKVLRIFATIVQKPKEIYFNILLSKVVPLELDKVISVKALIPIILGYYAERLTEGTITENMALVPLNGEKDLDEEKEQSK